MDPLSINYGALSLPQFARTFNGLNRSLVKAESPQEWNPAVTAMNDFLDTLDEKLIARQDIIAGNQADSSRAISMCLTLAALGTQYRLEQFKPKDEAGRKRRALIEESYLPVTGGLRKRVLGLAKKYFQAPVFDDLREAMDQEIFPLLDPFGPKIPIFLASFWRASLSAS